MYFKQFFEQHRKIIKEIVGGFDDATVRQRVAADLARALCPEIKFDRSTATGEKSKQLR